MTTTYPTTYSLVLVINDRRLAYAQCALSEIFYTGSTTNLL